MKRVLVIGGGAAGLSAAVELSRRGIPSTVVERLPRLGGKAIELACKGAPRCVRCDACFINNLITEARSSPLVTAMTGTEVDQFIHKESGIEARVLRNGISETVDAGAVIVATGALPFDPRQDPRLHVDECAGVLSAEEVEGMLVSTGGVIVPATGSPPREMAIVQCVGSRDAHRGAPYCSKVCCKYGYRLGRHLRSIYPELKMTFFYMDWRPLEGEKEALEEWAKEDGNVRIIRSRPSEIVPSPRPTLRYASPGESVMEEEFDLVMLSVGLSPRSPEGGLNSLDGLGKDENGFLISHAHRVLLAGSCGGPKDLRESAEEGVAAAGLAAKRLGARG